MKKAKKTNTLDGKMQSVFLTFSDGSVAQFAGRAVCDKGDTREIVGIQFGEPHELPSGCSFEEIKVEQ